MACAVNVVFIININDLVNTVALHLWDLLWLQAYQVRPVSTLVLLIPYLKKPPWVVKIGYFDLPRKQWKLKKENHEKDMINYQMWWTPTRPQQGCPHQGMEETPQCPPLDSFLMKLKEGIHCQAPYSHKSNRFSRHPWDPPFMFTMTIQQLISVHSCRGGVVFRTILTFRSILQLIYLIF